MSLCNQILDVADDFNKSLLREIVQEAQLPAFVKKAQVATADVASKLGREDFALVILTKEGHELHKFPFFDEANTWLSCRYFEKTAHKLPIEARKVAGSQLKMACSLYGLELGQFLSSFEDPCDLFNNTFHEGTSLKKTASTSIAIEESAPDGSDYFYALKGNYAMPSPAFVKKAAAYFVNYEKEFADANDRHVFANSVLERAKELSVNLEQSKTLAKYAGADYGDSVGGQIRLRADLLQTKPEMSAALDKIAAKQKELPAQDFANLLYAFDKKASLDRYYGSYLADAYKATFEEKHVKQASGYMFEDESEGLSCSEKDLSSAFDKKYDKIKGYFGPSVADQLKKHGCAIFESLPIDAKTTIAKIAKGQL